ncbi:MAG: hypothetical protein LBP51_06405 [Deferribacteraceae bacterium]|nr:hypothetical protein [Deferribacteraceae bacterium]
MNKPKIEVNFNELAGEDMVLLSRSDYREDIFGNKIHLYEGLGIDIFEPDYIDGARDDLIASGYAVRCRDELYKDVKWCCKIKDNWIRHESEIK